LVQEIATEIESFRTGVAAAPRGGYYSSATLRQGLCYSLAWYAISG
jgi:hypothetical protein